MKLTKGLNIKDKSIYFFTVMLIINEIAGFSKSTMYEISYNENSDTLHIVFNNITCVFRKRSENKYLIFCKTKKMRKC